MRTLSKLGFLLIICGALSAQDFQAEISFNTKQKFFDNDPIIFGIKTIVNSKEKIYYRVRYSILTQTGQKIYELGQDTSLRDWSSWDLSAPLSEIQVKGNECSEFNMEFKPRKTDYYDALLNNCYGNTCQMSNFYGLDLPSLLPSGQFIFKAIVWTNLGHKFNLEHVFSIERNENFRNLCEKWNNEFLETAISNSIASGKPQLKSKNYYSSDKYVYASIDTSRNDRFINKIALELNFGSLDSIECNLFLASIDRIRDKEILLFVLNKLLRGTGLDRSSFLVKRGVNRYSLYSKTLIRLNAIDNEIAEVFYYRIFQANSNPCKYKKYYPQYVNNMGLITESQLGELSKLIKYK